jgi:hypothetical protein
VRRPFLAVLACAPFACAPAPLPATAPPGSDARPVTSLEVTGRLSRKGTAELSTWAVTDPAGRSWLLVDVPPLLDARFRSLRDDQVTVRLEPIGSLVLDQARLLEIVRPAP